MKKSIESYYSFFRNLLGETLFDFITTTGVGFVINFLSYVISVLLARSLSEKDFSVYSVIVGMVYMIVIPAVTLQTQITKSIADNKDKESESFIAKYSVLALQYGFLVSIIVTLLAPFIAKQKDLPVRDVMLLGIIMFGAILMPVVKGILLGLQKIHYYNIFNLSEAILRILIIVIAITFVAGPALPILSFTLPGVFLSLFVLWRVGGRPLFSKVIALKKPESTFNLNKSSLVSIMLALFFYNLAITLDVQLLGKELVAPYSALGLLGKMVYFASTLVSTVLFAKLVAERDEWKKIKIMGLGFFFSASIGVIFAGTITFFSDQVIQFMFDGKYSEIKALIPITVFSMIFYSFSLMLVNYSIVQGYKLHIIILLLSTIILAFLFTFQVSSLKDAVYTQAAVFMFIFTFLSLFIAFKSIFGERR